MNILLFFSGIFGLILALNATNSDEFHEELFIKPLPNGYINTYFQFTTEWLVKDKTDLHHTHLVARPIAEIFNNYDLEELHLSLTNGLWRYENWGYPPADAAPGAELWAWFKVGNHSSEYIDGQWKQLCGILTGLLCASLSFIDQSNTISPTYTLRPTFSTNEKNFNISNYEIRYATLPREIVCTENLTPWKKLLPVRSSGGLVSLLSSGYIHKTNYHSLGLHIRRLAIPKRMFKDIEVHKLFEIRQTVNLVFDKRTLGMEKDWSIRRMFGQGLNGASELAKSSKVMVDITNDEFRLIPEPSNYVTSQRGGAITKLAIFDVRAEFPHEMFNIAAVYNNKDNLVTIVPKPPLFATRFLLGIAQEQGKIMTKITNTHWAPLNIILLENLPWYVPVYLHTLKIVASNTEDVIEPKIIQYLPGRLRERSTYLEIGFQIPKKSSIIVSLNFDYVFLKWLEYPPDANHGQYIGSAILMSQLPIGRNYTAAPVDARLYSGSFNASRSYGYIVNIRTESLLITLPTPDFSMPYNVICLACTVVALAFGPIHNLSTRKLMYSKKSKENEPEPTSLLGKLKNLLTFKKSNSTIECENKKND